MGGVDGEGGGSVGGGGDGGGGEGGGSEGGEYGRTPQSTQSVP